MVVTLGQQLLLVLTFSVLVANPKKTTLHGGQSRSWSAEQGKKEKKKKYNVGEKTTVILYTYIAVEIAK